MEVIPRILWNFGDVCLSSPYAVLNCADPGTTSTDNSEAAAAVADVPQFEYLPTPIRRRKAFANAAGQGLAVLELSPKDAKAIEELNHIVSALF